MNLAVEGLASSLSFISFEGGLYKLSLRVAWTYIH